MLIHWLTREMREADPGTPTGGTAPETPPPPPDQAETADADEAYDKARAMETIRKLRQVEKDALRAQKRLAELEAHEKARADAELSEVEKLKKELADLKTAHEQATVELTRARVLEAVRKAAVAKGLNFHEGALEDALRLGDLDEIEVGDDGKITKVGEAVTALAKAKSYLLKPTASASADLDGARRGATNQADEQADRANKRFAAWGLRGQG